MKITATLEQEMVIEFTEPDLAKAFFIDGDWKKSFYTFDDLAALGGALMLSVRDKLIFGDHWREDGELKSGACVEGYPYFYLETGQKLISKYDPKIGQIIITGDCEPEACFLETE